MAINKLLLAIVMLVLIVIIAIVALMSQHSSSTSTTSVVTSSAPTTIHVGNPYVTNAQAEALIGPNANYSLSMLSTPSAISGYRLGLDANATAVWFVNYLNGTTASTNLWGLEQVVILADTLQKAQYMYSQLWNTIVASSPPPSPTNGTYNGMVYSYTFNATLHRTAFVGMRNDYVVTVVVSTYNVPLNITRLVQVVANDLG